MIDDRRHAMTAGDDDDESPYAKKGDMRELGYAQDGRIASACSLSGVPLDRFLAWA